MESRQVISSHEDPPRPITGLFAAMPPAFLIIVVSGHHRRSVAYPSTRPPLDRRRHSCGAQKRPWFPRA